MQWWFFLCHSDSERRRDGRIHTRFKRNGRWPGKAICIWILHPHRARVQDDRLVGWGDCFPSTSLRTDSQWRFIFCHSDSERRRDGRIHTRFKRNERWPGKAICIWILHPHRARVQDDRLVDWGDWQSIYLLRKLQPSLDLR